MIAAIKTLYGILFFLGWGGCGVDNTITRGPSGPLT